MRIAIATAAFLIAGAAHATPLSPTFQVFGDVADVADPDPTFGGTGIPTSPFAYSQFTDAASGDVLTLSLGITQRFDNPEPNTNPGQPGTYKVLPGSNIKGPNDVEGALWSYNIFAEVTDPLGSLDTTLADYGIKFFFDTDAGEDTDVSELGVSDFNLAGIGALTRFELNTNLFFLDPTVPLAGVTYGDADFDANALGEYDFALQAVVNGQTETVAIEVNAVPLPAPVFMLLAGIGGLGFMGWRKRRAA